METSGNDVRIVPLLPVDALGAADLFIEGIPNALLSTCERNFLAKFFIEISRQETSCVFVAKGQSGDVVGTIGGTLRRHDCYRRIIRRNWFSLLRGVGYRALNPRVLARVFHYMVFRVTNLFRKNKDYNMAEDGETYIDEELLFIAVSKDFRGRGVGKMLITTMNKWYMDNGFHGAYIAFVEADNLIANRFYQRLGARPVSRAYRRGALMNNYHVKVTSHESF